MSVAKLILVFYLNNISVKNVFLFGFYFLMPFTVTFIVFNLWLVNQLFSEPLLRDFDYNVLERI